MLFTTIALHILIVMLDVRLLLFITWLEESTVDGCLQDIFADRLTKQHIHSFVLSHHVWPFAVIYGGLFCVLMCSTL